jgi:hypothetical protein
MPLLTAASDSSANYSEAIACREDPQGAKTAPNRHARRAPADFPRRKLSVENFMSLGKTIVVGVGAEDGLGAALSRCYAANDRHVLVAGRSLEKVEIAD